MTHVSKTFILSTLASALILASNNVNAEDDTSTYDDLWSYGSLYESKNSSGIQKIAFTGRLQGDAAHFEADEGNAEGETDEFEDANWRRLRMGIKTNITKKLVFHVEADLNINNDADDTYNRLTDAYIAYTFNQHLKIKALKQSAGFTMDGTTSSKSLLTLQRNNLTNNLWFTDEYFTGISASGAINSNWSYKAGIYSSNDDQEIAVDGANAFSLMHLKYKFGKSRIADKASISLDYVHKDTDDEDGDFLDGENEKDGAPDYENIVSLHTQMQKGKFGLSAEYAFGQGYNETSDIWGVVVMPHFNFTTKLQGVLRYTYIESDQANAIKLGRYEKEISSEKGDEYQEMYGGVNYFFYGHKLKWQTGVQYTEMTDSTGAVADYKGWGVTTGFRMSW
ncbi:porin [Colwelliaceae bacterium BS250]